MSELGELQDQLSRRRFLGFSLKTLAATSLALQGINCGPGKETPKLIGFSEIEYHNMNAVAEILLEGSPVPNFDTGKALDEFIYGRNVPLSGAPIAHEMAAAPSSLLIALLLDFSLTPFVKLSKEKKLKRLMGWKGSSDPAKRALYAAYRQLTLFLLGSDQKFQDWMGPTRDVHLQAYRKR